MTIGILWEFFEFAADKYVKSDMQKDRIVTSVNSVLINDNKENVPIRIDNIEYTIIYGKDVTPEELEAVENHIAENYDNLEYESIEGGQDVYSFILAIE